MHGGCEERAGFTQFDAAAACSAYHKFFVYQRIEVNATGNQTATKVGVF